jgi:tetratricopeptide (TPR) repeat protein
MVMNEIIEHWLNDLAAEPMAAIQRLVLGKVAIPAWSRASLREIFIEVYQTHAAALDDALTGWLQERLLKMPPEQTPTLAWATDLQEVFRAVAGLPLPKLAHLLRDSMRDFRIWLKPLATDKSLDPEASYLAALAWAETNKHLEGLWLGLALHRAKEPMHYIDIGLLGLRKGRDEQGNLPSKAPFVFLATLIDLADVPDMSKKNWLLTTRAILGGYRYSQETWVREFAPVIEARPQAQNGPKWIKGILPSLQTPSHHTEHTAEHPHTIEERKSIIKAVAERGPLAVGVKLTTFLKRHRDYANLTHDSHFIVRTFNSLAEKARMHDPDWAIARAEEAIFWDKNNALNWTVMARCQWARGLKKDRSGDAEGAELDCLKAIDTLWEARFQFSWDPFVRNELGKLYRDAGDLDTAEAVYREAIADFPQNVACHCGLAEVLREKGLIDEAIQVYRETRLMFPRDPYSRTALAWILLHRSAARHDKDGREQARALLQEAVDLGNNYARNKMKSFDQRWSLLASQQEPQAVEDEEVNEAIALKKIDPSKMRPAQRIGRSLLLQWQTRRAETSEEQERLFNEAEELLNLPEVLMGECLTAFMEARGFLMLARGRAAEARDYFEQQAASFTKTNIQPSFGIRLGLAEARTRLGEHISLDDEAALMSFGPDGSILPLVLKVIRLLETTTEDTELRNLLIELYPRVMDIAGLSTEVDRKAASADSMIAQLLIHDVFRPASINNADDLQDDISLQLFRDALNTHRNKFFSVFEEFALVA